MESINKIRLELKRLQEENARLKYALQKYGIDYNVILEKTAHQQMQMPLLSLEEKVALFRLLFHGREDVFARRWYSPKTNKSGYQPVCIREWDRKYCDKKTYHRDFRYWLP